MLYTISGSDYISRNLAALSPTLFHIQTQLESQITDTGNKMASLTYTTDQLEAYLERIGYNSPGSLFLVKSRIGTDPLGTLSELQRRHLCAIPWGNSGLHYTQHHTISIHPQSVYEKLIHRRLDGYCMENTNLFFVVLRSLGYQVYATGGRVSQATATGNDNGLYLAQYVQCIVVAVDDMLMNGSGHMILIVTIENERYMVGQRCLLVDGTKHARLTLGLGIAALPVHCPSRRMLWRLMLRPLRCAWSKSVRRSLSTGRRGSGSTKPGTIKKATGSPTFALRKPSFYPRTLAS